MAIKVRNQSGQEFLVAGSGKNGKSAYQIAVDNGFQGSEKEWLDSLKGSAFEYNPDLGTAPFEVEITPEEDEALLAEEVDYDNSISGIEAGTVQTAIDTTIDLAHTWFMSGGVPYGKEIKESWESLLNRTETGNFKGIHIGDYKPITLAGGETVIPEVGGIDQYYRCGNTEIGHHIDFISRDCLAGTKKFNNTDNNNGTAEEPNPWRASQLFQTLNDETTGVYAKLPEDLKPCIIEKLALLEQRYSSAGPVESNIGWAWYKMGKLWLPTEVEVFGNTFWSDGDSGYTGGGGCNLQYPIFYGGAKHIIKGNGNGGARCNWWELFAQRRSATYFCVVSYGGNANTNRAADDSVYAPLCFRIG